MAEFKCIVAGSRDITQYDLVESFLDRFFRHKRHTHDIIIVDGRCRGIDRLGGLYAIRKGLPPSIPMPADWDNLGKGAGFIRNQAMADIADAAVVFILDNSNGSADMIRRACKKGIPVIIVHITTIDDILTITKITKEN